MQLSVVDTTGNNAGAVDVAESAFGVDFNEPLVHQVVTAFMAGSRSGTKAQKTRAEVRGGGRKPWRQKGTGHARAGTTRGPLWRTGGVTFAAKPRDYSQKVNRKMYRAAMRCVVSQLVREERLMVVDGFGVESMKTRELVAKLNGLGVSDVLIVAEEPDLNLLLASRNLHWAAVLESSDLNPVTLMAFEKVVITTDALKQLEERLG